MEAHKDNFRRTAKRGPKPKGKENYFDKFHCKKCKLNFATSLGSMVEHAVSHDRDAVIKIGKVKGKGGAAGNLRPEEHVWNATTGRTFIGSDARLHRFIFPSSINRDEEGRLLCRKKCGFSIEHEHSWSFQKQSKAVEMHAAHEKKCKHRVPVGR